MPTPLHTFKKGERLRKKQHLDALFQSQYSFMSYPFRVVYCQLKITPKTAPAQILISIPKRKIKKAVNRNLLKRRTKEAYRQQKNELYTQLQNCEDTLAIGFVYVANTVLPYEQINESMKKSIFELKNRV